MVFSSIIFIFGFLPLILLLHSFLYLFLKSRESRVPWLNLLLLFSSIFFYAWGEPKNVLILLGCTLFTFTFGNIIERNNSRKHMWLGVGGNLLVLIYFKYGMLFFVPNVPIFNNLLPSSFQLDTALKIALPLGISFYTFQAISYLLDVAAGKVPAAKNFINFGCYLTMFPQLVAGPIVRYKQICHQLTRRTLTLSSSTSGISRFIIGLAKKILIADTLGRVADAAFAVPNGELSAYGAWVGIICYTMQIYYDFSGYSDMAIGMGMMLGFSFPENFNYPYIAKSIQEFWQRWHISLSNWFRDYLYIPLGGNKNGPWKTYRNLFVVFLLCGFWHGAAWTFMAWGAYYGIFLIIERIFPHYTKKLPRIVSHLYVMIVVMVGWVLFRADSFHHAFSYYKAMLGFFEGGLEINRVWLMWYGYDVAVALSCAIIFSFPVVPWVTNFIKKSFVCQNPRWNSVVEGFYYIVMLVLLLVTFMPIFGSQYSAFIYFRF